jgi:hypothetical protein
MKLNTMIIDSCAGDCRLSADYVVSVCTTPAPIFYAQVVVESSKAKFAFFFHKKPAFRQVFYVTSLLLKDTGELFSQRSNIGQHLPDLLI